MEQSIFEPVQGSGKSDYQANAPLVSVDNKNKFGEEKDYKIIQKAKMVSSDTVSRWPFSDLEVGQGMLIYTEKGSTTDKLMENLYRAVADARLEYSEVERDRDGNEVLDMVIVKRRKTNADGSIQLGVNDQPMFDANQEQKPRLVYSSHFSIKPVIKGADVGDNFKAERDGALVIRQI